jgi:hypothetical protein
VHPLGRSAAVLVGLDLHHRGLGPPAQARDGERVRVALLQVVHRAQRQVLPPLLEGAGLGQVGRQRRAVVGGDEGGQLAVDRLAGHADRPDELLQRREVPALEPAAQAEEGRVPLPGVGDVVEAPVVQLVADRQAELQVLVGQHVGGAEGGGSVEGPRGQGGAGGQVVAEGFAERTPGLGQVHGLGHAHAPPFRCAPGM